MLDSQRDMMCLLRSRLCFWVAHARATNRLFFLFSLASRRLAHRVGEGRSPSQKTPRQRARFARILCARVCVFGWHRLALQQSMRPCEHLLQARRSSLKLFRMASPAVERSRRGGRAVTKHERTPLVKQIN